MEWISVLFLGFFLGMRHSTDADHVVAVTTIVSQQKKLSFAAIIGLVWGLGHTLTIFIVGIGIIYLKFTISPQLGLSLEFGVGLMIVVLGVISLLHFIPHGMPNNLPSHQIGKKPALYTYVRPLIVGLIHGLAGSAAVALLVLNAISSEKMAFFYLLIFGLGTVAGMMLTTLLIGLPYVFSRGFGSFHKILGISTAVFSIGFGLVLMYELGIVNGLFTDHPVWVPE